MNIETNRQRPEKPIGTEGQSFRIYLQNELLRRCKANPGYSLRAFSRTLQISPSSLSRILRGEREVSEAMRARLGGRLGLSPIAINSLALEKKSHRAMKPTAQNFKQLALDTFSFISNWYHYGILELTRVKTFNSNPRWIAKTLGVTVTEINAAVECLQRLGLLKIKKGGQWTAILNYTNVGKDGEFTDVAHRNLQKQVLQMAIKAMDEVPVHYRDQSSMTMAVDVARLPKAIEMITEFRRHLCGFLEGETLKEDVFQLSISLFPITTIYQKD
jgi:plasmid maintenance system antidote protein VapI